MNTAAVVGNADQFDAAGLQFHRDFVCLRIEAVFHDFLEGVGRAFDHFAGGNLVNQVVGQGGNAHHAFRYQ